MGVDCLSLEPRGIGDANDVTLRWFAQQFHCSVLALVLPCGPDGMAQVCPGTSVMKTPRR
jgi:hypothetical protein